MTAQSWLSFASASARRQIKLPESTLQDEAKRFTLYERVLTQQPKDQNKGYSLHEPDVDCVGKEKDHKPYEYGRKASVVATLESKVVVGVESHDVHELRRTCNAKWAVCL